MLKYFCDKCKLISDDFDTDKNTYHLTVRGPESKTKQGYDESIDLCSKCYKDFKNGFMKENGSKL